MKVITLGEILLRFSTRQDIRIKNTDEKELECLV